jgi:hypothetical protein
LQPTKITDGANDRSKTETIAQTGEGLPDDAGSAVDISDDEVERIRDKLTGGSAHDRVMAQVNEEIDLPQKGSA